MWPPQSSGGLFSTPTAARSARGGSGGEFGFGYTNYGPDEHGYGVGMDDTPIRRAPVKEVRTLGLSGYSTTSTGSGANGGMFAFVDSPLSGRGGKQEGRREGLRASVE